jgi:hypothetical protein
MQPLEYSALAWQHTVDSSGTVVQHSDFDSVRCDSMHNCAGKRDPTGAGAAAQPINGRM